MKVVGISIFIGQSVIAAQEDSCGLGYMNVDPCPSGSSPGTPQTDWTVTATQACKGPCDTYSTFQWTADDGLANDAIKSRNGGQLISPNHRIPETIDALRCWFRPDYSWGMQNGGTAPPWNPQPEAAYLDDAGNGLGGGLPGPDTTVGCCCQEECTMEMLELRHWIYQAPGCTTVDIDYNTNGNNGRVLLTRTSNRNGELTNTKHEACMCGDKAPEQQLPFYYYVVQGPATDQSTSSQLWWLNSLRTAYNNLFDIWSQKPPCSGECVIVGGASDAWVTYDHSTARSIMFQLRAFAAFDPHALANACGPKGVMLMFGGMTLNGNAVSCEGEPGWGQTGASCDDDTSLPSDFYNIVTTPDDDTFFSQAGSFSGMTFETDRAVVKIDPATGVQVARKESATCGAQPSLNHPWRCAAHGGVNDESACAGAGGPTTTTTTGTTTTGNGTTSTTKAGSWQPCAYVPHEDCCDPTASPAEFCQDGRQCEPCGGSNSCACPSNRWMV